MNISDMIIRSYHPDLLSWLIGLKGLDFGYVGTVAILQGFFSEIRENEIVKISPRLQNPKIVAFSR